jgi:hypothetical protein
MSDNTACKVCGGRRKIMGLGLMLKECANCNGTGLEAKKDKAIETLPSELEAIKLSDVNDPLFSIPPKKIDKRSKEYRDSIGRTLSTAKTDSKTD